MSYKFSKEELKNIAQQPDEIQDLLLEYFSNWKESLPAYFNKVGTIVDLYETRFMEWFEETYPAEVVNLISDLDLDRRWLYESQDEYNIALLSDLLQGNLDKIDFDREFKEILSEHGLEEEIERIINITSSSNEQILISKFE